jgi:hypothetical protein
MFGLLAGMDPEDRRRGDYGDLDGSCQPMTPMTPNSGSGGGSPKIKTEVYHVRTIIHTLNVLHNLKNSFCVLGFPINCSYFRWIK